MLKRLLIVAALVLSQPLLAARNAPWGSAKDLDIEYSKQKVVYDTAVNTVAALTSVLDRASYLSVLNGADPFDNKIVIVLHGHEIDYFATKNHPKHKALMERAQSLTVGGIIEIRMCRVAAEGRGYQPKDIHGFVSMVPMGDAEIVRLQHEGYAYMR
jgi:intracellular sulfur oxidation DsrE/DsrF family protein